MSDLAVWARAVGQTIRRLRTSQGLTQAELGGEHFSKSYISQLERGSVTPSLRALDILAERLGVPTTFFMEGTGQQASFLLKLATVAYFNDQIDQAHALALEIARHLDHLKLRERIEYQLLVIRLAGASQRWTDLHAASRGLEALLAQSPYRAPAVMVPFNYWWGKAWLAEGNRRQVIRRWETGFYHLRDAAAPPPVEGLHLLVELAELYRQLGDPHSSEQVTRHIHATIPRLADLEGLSRWFLARHAAGAPGGDEDLLTAAEAARDAEAWARARATLKAAEAIRQRLSESESEPALS